MSDRVSELAQIVWDYHQLGHSLVKSDCILTPCSHDPRVAVHSAELFLAGWAPMLVFSGNVGELTAGMYGQPEADYFAEVAVQLGVPSDRILIENRATNSGENILFSRALLERHHQDPDDFILVQKPFMERRTLATFQKIWPEKNAIVTSPPIEFADYPTEGFPRDRVIEIMVGDLERIIRYPALGFQTEQEIPDEVLVAYEQLIDLGYDGHLTA
jgi:uncharacterized SAM-binding protein YcdF (DUF218 family)